MRIRLFVEQLALIGALSSLVLAALWPHIRPLVVSIWSRVRFFDIVGWQQNKAAHKPGDWYGQQKHSSLSGHPRLSGHTIKRSNPTNSNSRHGSLNGYGQSKLVSSQATIGQHSNIQAGRQGLFAAHSGSSLVQDARQIAATNNGQSSISLILFTASIIALIMFSLMKLFSAKLKPSSANRLSKRYDASKTDFINHDEFAGVEKAATTARTFLGQQQQAKFMHDNDDLSYYEKKKLSRLSREERTRQLIARHGGKSVSKAIRSIISELEGQKQQLIAQSGASNLTGLNWQDETYCCCDCLCHLVGTGSENDLAKEDRLSCLQQEPSIDSGQTTTTAGV